MSKQGKTQANDEFLGKMRSDGFDTVFISELPYPASFSRCQLVLAATRYLIYIRDAT